MKTPKCPPDWQKLFQNAGESGRLPAILGIPQPAPSSRNPYIHWDKLRYRKAPDGFSHEEWWLSLKIKRTALSKRLPLIDKRGRPFVYFIPDPVQELLHQIDLSSGGSIGVPEPILNPHTRDRYLVSSLMQEGITSSILEGAVTTRDQAKEMIRSGRRPRDKSERMILNNYHTMRQLNALKDEALTPELVFEIHTRITLQTLDDPTEAGRFRYDSEKIRVTDEIYHDPPPASELPSRMKAMCAFANGETPRDFVHPVIRAIALHFWLAYDHPFVDGNGRTARALFYWLMLRSGFWLFEYISISRVLLSAPVKYYRSFLYTENDDNDLNYFIVQQASVILRAIQDLETYIEKKSREIQSSQSLLRAAG